MRAGLPTLSVRTAGDHDILVERTIAKAARDAGDERIPADGEPHGPLLLVGDVVTDEPVSVDDLLGRVGIDALRFAALYAAAPARPIRWNDEVARHCAGFLDRLWGFAQPRLEAATIPEEPSIDGSQRAHRLLGKWCRIAVERVTENLAAAETHRATRNVMLLLERIEDFEARAAEGANELSGTDRDAVAFALIVLVQLVAPLAPHLAQELWETAGRPGLVADEPWPTVDAAERRLELAGSGGRPS
jgi:leucyl-tRNA synthetase